MKDNTIYHLSTFEQSFRSSIYIFGDKNNVKRNDRPVLVCSWQLSPVVQFNTTLDKFDIKSEV